MLEFPYRILVTFMKELQLSVFLLQTRLAVVGSNVCQCTLPKSATTGSLERTMTLLVSGNREEQSGLLRNVTIAMGCVSQTQ